MELNAGAPAPKNLIVFHDDTIFLKIGPMMSIEAVSSLSNFFEGGGAAARSRF